MRSLTARRGTWVVARATRNSGVHNIITGKWPPVAAAGADSITIHVEAGPELHRSLKKIREHGKRPGVSIKPATPPREIAEALDLVDLVLVMSVEPGFAGQAFMPAAIDKIAEV
ncbi:MAG: hypothetical protein L0271_21560, partial [Gemmatimonadetes bacterium]|nr:hypothetical protein [Gemmatimonadota bacterium]